MDLILTDDLQNHWIFQDAEKFKWWADLHFMADENGEIHMSLSALVHRWKAPKTTIQRFLKKICSEPIGGTKVEQQVEQITLSKTESYEGSWNSKWNKSGTAQRTPPCSPSFSSTTPPSISPPIIPQEIPSPYAHMREAEFVERYREEGDGGMWANVALMLHLKSTAECITLFERFVMEYQHNGDEHQTYGDFKRHFLQWSRIAITKEQKYNGNNRSDYSKRGRADVPSDISLDF